jgi:hypothetical protein
MVHVVTFYWLYNARNKKVFNFELCMKENQIGFNLELG